MDFFWRAFVLGVGILIVVLGVMALDNGFYTATSRSGGTFIVSGQRATAAGWLMIAFGVAVGASALFKFSEKTTRLTMVAFITVVLMVHSCGPK